MEHNTSTPQHVIPPSPNAGITGSANVQCPSPVQAASATLTPSLPPVLPSPAPTAAPSWLHAIRNVGRHEPINDSLEAALDADAQKLYDLGIDPMSGQPLQQHDVNNVVISDPVLEFPEVFPPGVAESVTQTGKEILNKQFGLLVSAATDGLVAPQLLLGGVNESGNELGSEKVGGGVPLFFVAEPIPSGADQPVFQPTEAVRQYGEDEELDDDHIDELLFKPVGLVQEGMGSPIAQANARAAQLVAEAAELEEAPIVVNIPGVVGDEKLTRTESKEYDFHVQQVLLEDPVRAANFARVKGWTSPHVGFIRTVEQANRHIQHCEVNGLPIGGNEIDPEVMGKTIRQVEGALRAERLRRARDARDEFVNNARQDWKDAIERRRLALLELDNDVKKAHDAYAKVKNMTIQEYIDMEESENE